MRRRTLGSFALLCAFLGGCDALLGLDEGEARPLAPLPACGDGHLDAGESCDDGNESVGDGCDAACAFEHGFVCDGAPSVCATVCGDGLVAASEACDDGALGSGDGCAEDCTVEHGFTCAGEPSTCATSCGDGVVAANEACDDGALVSGDGCDGACALEEGFACQGEPSACGPVCGDGVRLAGEACDDGNTAGGDCCSAACAIEAGCEIEPNDTRAAANPLDVVGLAGVVHGTIAPSGDVDWLRLDVAPGTIAHLDASTSDGFTSTCADGSLATTLTLHGDVVLVSDTDGGSGACSHLTQRVLAPGSYFLEVSAAPASPSPTFDYTLVATLVACGDGTLGGDETCDDGGAIAGDGCNALCRDEAQSELEPNGDVASASGPFVPDVTLAAAFTTPGDVDVFALDVPAVARLSLATFDGAGPPTCGGGTNTALTLLEGDGVTVLAAATGGGTGACAALDASVTAALTDLPAGLYYAVVTTEAGPGPYTLVATFDALCGDGVVGPGEECEGPAGCDALCQRIPTCGDGSVDAPETCDDGNVASGDGCGATCLLDEVEPNDDAASADARALAFPSLLVNDDRVLHGAITPAGDVDFVRIELGAPTVLRVETLEGTAQDCPTLQLVVELRDAAGLLLDTDTGGGGIGSCGAFTFALAAGTYYATVAEAGFDDIVPDYALVVETVAELAESEPNDTPPAADTMAGTSLSALGNVPVASDGDYYVVTVPAGGSLRAEVIEGGAELCKVGEIDSTLDVYSPGAALLASDGDDGRGLCSLVDGRGATPQDASLQSLAAGVYYVRVGANPLASGAAAVFPYRLVVTVQ